MEIFSNKSSFYIFLILILSIFNTITTKFISFKSIDNNNKHSKEYINLINYIKSYGGYINPKLTINENSLTNRYILTKEKILKNEKILFIPEKILISKLHPLLNRKCIEAYGLHEDHDYDCIVYFMTLDKYNKSSIFKPYYDFLPQIDYKDFIISLTQDEIKELNKTDIIEGITSFNRFYNIALEPVKEKLEKFAKKNNIDKSQIFDDFKKNFILVGTRNFGRPDYIADFSTMVPYLDLLNHSDKNNTYWFYDEFKSGYILIAMKDIEKNEEVTDSYGKYCNSHLYKTYGFVIKGNIVHDRLYIKINREISIRLDLDFVDDTVYHIFDKFDYDKINLVDAKKMVENKLNEKKEYYLRIKNNTNREALKIIFKEYLDIIDIYLNKLNMINSVEDIKNYYK